jgi:hypothetical protein
MKCILFDKENKPKRIAKDRGTWKALYPVYMGRPPNYNGRRGWFWLYECTDCGEELIRFISTSFPNCKCKKPKNIVTVTCINCEVKFEKSRKSAQSSENQYCSEECKEEYLICKVPTDEWLALDDRIRSENLLLIPTPKTTGGIYDYYFE